MTPIRETIHRLSVPPAEEGLASCPSIQEAVRSAHREWVAATQYFDAVSDAELVDHAIYLMTAAERKYMYLLNQAGRSS